MDELTIEMVESMGVNKGRHALSESNARGKGQTASKPNPSAPVEAGDAGKDSPKPDGGKAPGEPQGRPDAKPLIRLLDAAHARLSGSMDDDAGGKEPAARQRSGRQEERGRTAPTEPEAGQKARQALAAYVEHCDSLTFHQTAPGAWEASGAPHGAGFQRIMLGADGGFLTARIDTGYFVPPARIEEANLLTMFLNGALVVRGFQFIEADGEVRFAFRLPASHAANLGECLAQATASAKSLLALFDLVSDGKDAEHAYRIFIERRLDEEDEGWAGGSERPYENRLL